MNLDSSRSPLESHIGAETLASLASRAVGAGADPCAAVRAATDRHRRSHACEAYTYDKGAFLVAVAAALAPRRILELGTALGYTALSLASGAPEAKVDTIERDAIHVDLAREEIVAAGMTSRVTVWQGDFESVLTQLAPGYDLAFFDGFAPEESVYRQLLSLLTPTAVLVSANLTLRGRSAAGYVEAILNGATWDTWFIDRSRETAVSVRRASSRRSASTSDGPR